MSEQAGQYAGDPKDYGYGDNESGAAYGAGVGQTFPLAVPVTRDGVPIHVGMRLWDTCCGDPVVVTQVWSKAFVDDGGMPRVMTGCMISGEDLVDHVGIRWWNCYSTKEAAKKGAAAGIKGSKGGTDGR